MGVHADHVRNIFDGTRRGIPILTVLGALNDNYEGGELEFWEDEKIKLKAGEALIFPSNFLYPHQVLPITKGNRYSFAVWIW
jgi:predicted 2-oxoglutarate/Fe(II)-dependent dioxygenase YbiX